MLSGLGGCLFLDKSAMSAARPPQNLSTIEEFRECREAVVMGCGTVEISGSSHTVLLAPAGRYLASGPSAYLFDEAGRYVDWTADMGHWYVNNRFDLTGGVKNYKAGLVKMLPGILDQVRGLVGKRRVTVVFDRGGFSPKLFQQIIAAGFDLLTYRKGRRRSIPRSRFVSHTARCGGRKVSYILADQEVRLLKGKLRLRQVTRRMENGHQTAILT
jgi:hypothetical protein